MKRAEILAAIGIFIALVSSTRWLVLSVVLMWAWVIFRAMSS